MTWLAIKGYEGIYAVSDEGEVMSMNYAKSGLPGIMTKTIRRGYASVFFRGKRKGRWFTMHSLVAAAFIGARPDGLAINHIDGNKLNNHLSNLEYVTPSENQKHSFRIGLQDNKGENHSQARLDDEKIRSIREMLAKGITQADISKIFGVHQSQISNIMRKKAWAHVVDLGE